MTLKLNDIVFDDFNIANLARSESRLGMIEARAEASDVPVPERLSRLSIAGEKAVGIALEHYALERDRAGIVAYARRGAAWLARWAELPDSRVPPVITWYYAQYVSWATAFADPSTRQRLNALPSSASETHREAGALYSHILTAFLRGEIIDEPLAALRMACMDRKATKFLSTTVLACTDAMRATLDGNAAGLNQALEDLVAQHKQDVKGEYRTNALRGFMNAYGLFYVRIALERGIPLTIDSPYLPVWLVDLCRTTPPTAS
jgi:hypothetical protein